MHKFLFLVISITFLNTYICKAKISADSTMTVDRIGRGDSLSRIRQYNAAIQQYMSALKLFDKQVDMHKTLEIYVKIATVSLLMGEQDMGLEYALKTVSYDHDDSREIALIQAKAYELIGYVLSQRGDFDSSLAVYHKSLQIRKVVDDPNDIKVGHCLISMGNVHLNRGMYRPAIEAYKSASLVYHANGETGINNLAYAYNNMALAYEAGGSYNLALEHYTRALNSWKDLFGPENAQVGFAYNNIGTVYFHLDSLDKALDYYISSFNIKANLNNNDASKINTLINIGICYLRMKEYDQSINYTERAMLIADRVYHQNHPIIADINVLIGNVHLEQKKFGQAMDYYTTARDIFLVSYGDYHPDLAELYNFMAEVYAKRGDLKGANAIFDLAIAANIPAIDSLYKYPDNSLNSALNKVYLLQSLTRKSDLLIEIGIKDKSIIMLESALQILQQADTLVSNMRRFYIRQSDKVVMGQAISRVYENAIRACVNLYELSGDFTFHRSAFYFAERSRASILTEALNHISAKSFGQVPDDMLNLEKQLKADLSYYTSKVQTGNRLNNTSNSSELTIWENKLFSTNQSIDSLNALFEQDYPKYYQLKYENRILPLEDVQNKLDPQTCLIEYIVGDSSTYVFAITRKDFSIYQAPVDTSNTTMIRKFRHSLVDFSHPEQAYQNFTKFSYRIFEKYVKEAIQGLDSSINKLIIIPGGILSNVPFEILLTHQVSEPITGDYRALPYLIRKFGISYGYSTSLLFNKYERKEETANTDLLAFAPNYDSIAENSSEFNRTSIPSNQEISPLKYNVTEIESVNEYISGDIHINKAASESTFKKSVRNYKILHLAMHALIDNQEPMNSKLVFAQSPDNIEDNFLYSHELYNMEIPVDLTVLSACESGLGKLAKGEGMMSLARAFSYAGCPSVVMSYWSVNDWSTSVIMKSFYEYLSEGMEKGEALRNAKMEYLDKSGPIEANPFYWGSFVVIGDTSPLDIKPKYSRYLFIVLIVLIVGGLFLTWRIKNEDKVLTQKDP